MQLIAYLNFDGTCAEAFQFYERCLGGKIVRMQTHADSPMADQVTPEWGDRIIHARLVAGDAVLMGSDTPPQSPRKPHGFAVAVQTADPAEAERVFHALAEGAAVQMPIQETFWAVRFGMLVDRFGTPWMVNCEGPAQGGGEER
jgi:PhnB protein